MNRIPLMFLALLSAAPLAASEPRFDAEALAKTITPFCDQQTIVILHVNLWKIDGDQLVDKVVQLAKLGRDQVTRDSATFRQNLAAFKEAGGRDLYVVISLADLTHAGVFVVPLYPDSKADAIERLGHLFQFGPQGQTARLHGAVVFGDPRNLARAAKLQAKPFPALAKAFAAAGDTTAQVLAPNPEMIEQMLASLPQELGKVPTRGVQWAAAGVELTPSAKLRLVVQSEDDKAAHALAELIARDLKQASVMPPVRAIIPTLGQLVPTLTPKVEGDRLVLTLEEPTLAAALLPVVQKQRAQSGDAMHMNHLRQIAVAMYMFHDTNHGFPPHASYDKDGNPLLSWRVHILPHLGEQGLYQQFHLNEPWDSPHNKTLIPQMPDIYSPPPNSHVAGEGKTLLVVPVGEDTAFPDRKGGTQIQDIARGTSNTILALEMADAHAVIWTKPEDLNVTPSDPLGGLVEPGQRGILVVMADASLRRLPVSIAPDALWEMFTRGGPRHADGFALSAGEKSGLVGRPWLLASLVAVALAVAGWFLARRFRPGETPQAQRKSP